jgi:hypothetical protein
MHTTTRTPSKVLIIGAENDITQEEEHDRKLRKNFGTSERNGKALLLEKLHKMGTYMDEQNGEEDENEEDGG